MLIETYIIRLLAAMVMALSFAGCSDNEEKDSGFDPSKVSVPKGSTELKSKEDAAALELAGELEAHRRPYCAIY